MWFRKKKGKLPDGLVDLHCHILPCVDDGAVDEGESLEMLHLFVEQGYRMIVATPHRGHPLFPHVNSEVVQEGLLKLKALVERHKIPLKIELGAEIYYSDVFLEELAGDKLIKLAQSPYMLIEFPPRDPLSSLKQLAFDLTLKGIRPVLAHPERYDIFLRRPQLAEEFVYAGWIFQLDLPSLIDENGPAIRKLALKFLQRGLYDLAASDMHHPQPPENLEKMLQMLLKKVGYEESKRLLVTNPQRMVEGKAIIENREN